MTARGYYCGPLRPLEGRQARLRTGEPGLLPGQVFAQFHDPVRHPNGAALNFGWHAFPCGHFEIEESAT
jgi:hypothetical protein